MKNINTILLLLFFALRMVSASLIHAQQFTFVHISDMHISDGWGGNIGNYDEDGEQFACNLRQFNLLNPKPAFVVVSGDVSNIGSKSPDGMYTAVTNHLYPQGGLSYPANGAYFIDSAQTIPIYFVSGNHEYYESVLLALDQTTTLQYFPAHIAPDVDYSIKHNGTLLVFLRSGGDCSLVEDPEDGMGITNQQCQWLRATINPGGGPPTNNRKIIILHHPVVGCSGTEVDGSPNTEVLSGPNAGSFLYNRETFLNICDSNNVDVILSGHVHQCVVANRAGNVVPENWTGGTRYSQIGNSNEGSYRVITVDSNFVSLGPPMVVDCMTVGLKTPSRTAFNIYPNPFVKTAILEISSKDEIRNYELKIYDVMGQEVKTITDINESTITIDRGELTSGIYYYRLTNSKGIAGSGKLIITD